MIRSRARVFQGRSSDDALGAYLARIERTSVSLLKALGLPAAAGATNHLKPTAGIAPPSVAMPDLKSSSPDTRAAKTEGKATGGAVSEGKVVEAEVKRESPRPTPPLEFPIDIDLPEASLSYVTAKGKITYVLTINPTDEEGAVDVKFSNLKPEVKLSYQKEVQSKLAEKYGKKLKISDTLTASKEGGVLGFDVDVEDTAIKGAKLTAAFHILEINKEKHEVEFISFEVADTVPLGKRSFEIAGMQLGYAGQVIIKVSFQPNWKKIGVYLAERFGITIAEDAALGTAAGGTGGAGAAAVTAPRWCAVIRRAWPETA